MVVNGSSANYSVSSGRLKRTFDAEQTTRKRMAQLIDQRTAMSEVRGSNLGRNIFVTISNV